MLPGWRRRSAQGTGHLQAPRPQHWDPDTSSCISYSRRQDTSGKKEASSGTGTARTATHHQEGSSPKREQTLVHLHKGPTPLLPTLGSPPVAGKVVPSLTGARLLEQGDKLSLCCPSPNMPAHVPGTTQQAEMAPGVGKSFSDTTAPGFYSHSQKRVNYQKERISPRLIS